MDKNQDREARFGVDPLYREGGDIWQGDILKQFSTDSPRLSFVISADCELAHDKGDGEVLVVPIVPIHSFLETHCYGSILRECVEMEIGELRRAVTARSKPFGATSDEALLDWSQSRTEAQISAELGGCHIDEARWVRALGMRVQAFSQGAESFARDGILRAAVFQSAFRLPFDIPALRSKADSLNKKARQVISNRLSPDRKDLFLLPGIPGEGELGYVLPFRKVSSISRASIVSSLSEAKRNHDAITVVASCRPVLTHAIVQKYVAFLSRIGLTNNFEADQKALAKIVVEEMLK